MKMIRTLLIFSVVITSSLANAGFVAWSGGNYNTSVDGVALQEGWVVALYKDSGKNNTGQWFNDLQLNQDGTVSISGGSGTSDDQLLGLVNYTAMLVNPVLTFYNFSKTVQVEDNVDIYTVLFDSSDVTMASQYIVADSAPTDSGAGDTGSPVSYNIGDTFSGTWQAIPEPAVASFIAIFGGGMLFARRIFKKA